MINKISFDAFRADKKIDGVAMGIYQHYKIKNLYQVIGVALHSETYEKMVIYKALYDCEKFGNGRVWVRPKSMFFENITNNGQTTPRFKLIEITEQIIYSPT